MNDFIYDSLNWLNENRPIVRIILATSLAGFFYFGVYPLKVKEEDATGGQIITVALRRIFLAALFVFIPICYLYLALMSKKITGDYEFFKEFSASTLYATKNAWALYVAIFIGTMTYKFAYVRMISPYISHLVRKYRVSQVSDNKSDIREEIQKLKAKDFDPPSFYKLESHMFLGLNEQGKPIYETDDDFKKRHIKIIGPSQTGKGVVQGVILDQAIKKGWCVGFFDIKPDDFIYSIMCKSCKEAGRPAPIVVDLNGIGPGSYNMFSNGTQREIISRLQIAMNVNETGTNADYYNVKERSLMLDLQKFFDGTLDGLEKLLKGIMPDGSKKPEYYEITEKSRAYVKELKLHKPLNPKKGRGFNVDKTLTSGAVFYIRGSVTDKLVKKAQTVMLMDIIQSVLRLGKQDKHFYLAIDEVKFLVSDMLSTGLSTVLSKGMNMSVAYQSPNNLLNLEDKKLNAAAIKSEIEINTLTTITYRAADGLTAEDMAKLTGQRNKRTVRSEEVQYDRMGAEKYTGRKQLQMEQEELISTNKMLSLPPRVAALIRPNMLSQVLYTSWIRLNPEDVKDVADLKKPTETNDEPEMEIVENESYTIADFNREAGIGA